MTAHEIALVVETEDWRRAIPDLDAACSVAAEATLAAVYSGPAPAEISILLTGDERIRALNRAHRGKDSATDVLSFPAGLSAPPPGQPLPLGDIVLALETCRRDAALEGKDFRAHIMHLIVHGVLHLLGYDHEDAADASVMEALEIEVLAGLGIADPY